MNDDQCICGEFVTKKITSPAVVVDCSKWMNAADSELTFGTFVTKKVTSPAAVVDCSKWMQSPVPHLRITLTLIDSGVSLESLQRTTATLIQKLHANAPDLGLEYDSARSGIENGTVVIGLTPRTPTADVAARLAALLVGHQV